MPLANAPPYPMYYPPPPPPHYAYYPHYTPARPQHHNTGSNSSHNHQTSSDLDNIEDPTLFPHIASWLVELDASPCGADGQCFAQFTDMIISQGYYRLCELTDSVTAEDLKSICPGILEGVAKALLCYAKADVKRLRDKALKDRKHEKRIHPA